MMFSLYIACLVRLFGLGPVAESVAAPVQRGVAVVEPYIVLCDVPCDSWYVMTPTGGPIIATGEVNARELAALLNGEYHRNRGQADFNGDGFTDSQDYFDFLTVFFSTAIGGSAP